MCVAWEPVNQEKNSQFVKRKPSRIQSKLAII